MSKISLKLTIAKMYLSNTHMEKMTICVWKKCTKQAISRLFLMTVEKCYIPQLVRESK